MKRLHKLYWYNIWYNYLENIFYLKVILLLSNQLKNFPYSPGVLRENDTESSVPSETTNVLSLIFCRWRCETLHRRHGSAAYCVLRKYRGSRLQKLFTILYRYIFCAVVAFLPRIFYFVFFLYIYFRILCFSERYL